LLVINNLKKLHFDYGLIYNIINFPFYERLFW